MSTVTLLKSWSYDWMMRLSRSLPILDCLRDRRGVSALLFMAFSVPFLGLAGFGMEVSTWYLERRHGQNAADAAAMAGVLPLIESATDYNGAQTAGTNLATLNGYTSGGDITVTVLPGTYSGGSFSTSGSCSSSCNAVKATVNQAMSHSLTAPLLGAAKQNVGEAAIASINVTGPACSLALDGGLS